MNRIFLSIFLILSAFLSHAQKATLKGKITDKSGEELIGVNVLFPGGKGVASDIDGSYSYTTEPGNYSVTFRFIGYESQTFSVTLIANEDKTLNVKLKEESNELDTYVVTAGKFEQTLGEVTVSMEVIKPALVESKNTISMENILDQIPGVSIQDGQLSIRGGSGFAYGAGSRVLMMVDDVPLLAGDAGDVRWNTLPVENIEQIEVIKGASSVLFGSSALNGVVNIRTATPTTTPLTKVNVYHGIYDNPQRKELIWWDSQPYFSGASFLHSRQMGNFDLVIGGNMLTDRGYREGEEENRGRLDFNTKWRSKKHERLSYGINGNTQVGTGGLFLIWMNDSNVYRPYGGLDTATTTVTYYKNYRTNLDPYITFFDQKGNRHSIKTRWYNTKNTNENNQASTANTLYAEYQFHVSMDSIHANLTSGMVATYTDVQSEMYGNHYGDNFAVYSQFDKKVGSRLNISVGLRGEYFKLDTAETISSMSINTKNDTIRFPFQPVVRAGVNYQLFEHTFLRASYGQGYRFPSIAEKFVSTSVGALNIFPNPSVQPERGWSAEIGAKQGFKMGTWKGYADVAFFMQQYQNMMEFTFGVYNPDSVTLVMGVPNNPNDITHWLGFSSKNVESAQITGVDFSLMTTGKIGAVAVTVYAGYTYMNPISINKDSLYYESLSDTNSTMLKYRFKHLAKADIQFDYKKLSVGVSMRYNSFVENIDKTFEDLVLPFGNGQISLGDYILPGLPDYRKAHNTGDIVFDVRIGCNVNKNMKLSAIVNNVLNREYASRPGDVQPPRNYAIQYALTF